MKRGPNAKALAIVAFSVAATVAVPAAEAGTVTTPVQAGGAFSVPVTSMRESRFISTIRQQYDFSCGSAALSTLLTHHYGFPVREQDVFAQMYEQGDKEKIRREGFSLLDMQNYLEAHGFKADGFKADLDQLAKAGIPAIVLVKENGYNHFVVVKGMKNGRVLVGDPSAGTRAMPRAQFEAIWQSRILFVVHNRQETAQFNNDKDWRAAPRAPLASNVYGNTTDVLLFRRSARDF
jgi:uncharacterized protein